MNQASARSGTAADGLPIGDLGLGGFSERIENIAQIVGDDRIVAVKSRGKFIPASRGRQVALVLARLGARKSFVRIKVVAVKGKKKLPVEAGGLSADLLQYLPPRRFREPRGSQVNSMLFKRQRRGGNLAEPCARRHQPPDRAGCDKVSIGIGTVNGIKDIVKNETTQLDRRKARMSFQLEARIITNAFGGGGWNPELGFKPALGKKLRARGNFKSQIEFAGIR